MSLTNTVNAPRATVKVVVSSSTAVTLAANEADLIICNGTSDQTINLPLLSAVPLGTLLKIKQSNGANDITVQQNADETPSSSNVIPIGSANAATSVVLTGAANSNNTLTLQVAKVGSALAPAWLVLSSHLNENVE
jgi:hypothetical protein